ncbi:hypothetical protein BDZ89DRAFT_112296 [Hymenopellis radicata]|nr:hypothetical protein BDZ89DRAFT_112296 [Hymenopellis radicata]
MQPYQRKNPSYHQHRMEIDGVHMQGLYTLTPDSNRRKFCKYLHQPQQLILSFMLLVAASAWEPEFGLEASPDPVICRDLVIRLAKICPTHMSWRDCDMELKAILAWAQTPNREISLFPWPLSLQSLSATAAFRKYPLVDWTARRFSSPKMENIWKYAWKRCTQSWKMLNMSKES